MISINSPTGNKELTKEDLLLLQKACHKMAQKLQERIYDMQVYFKGPKDIMDQMKSEIDQYQKLRMMFEDLEDL